MKDHYFKEQQYTLRLPGIIPLVALADIAYFGVVSLIALRGNHTFTALICGVLALLPALIIFTVYRNYRIRFDSESFVFRSVLGQKYHYRYEDIHEIVPVKNHFRIILENRTIFISDKGNGSRYFREYAEKKHGIKTRELINEYTILRDGLFPLLFGLVLLLSSIAIMITVNDFKTRAFFSLFTLCGVFFCMYWKNSSIRYNKEVLIYRNPLGKEKTYRFADLTGVTMVAGGEVLIFGNKKLSLDMFLKGIDELLEYVEQLSKERDLDLESRRKDLFKGNLLYPEQAKLSAIGLMILLIFLGLMTQFDPINMSNCETQSVIFSGFYDDKDIFTKFEFSRLELYSDESNIPYLINGFKEYGNKQNEFFKKLYRGESFRITGYYSSKKSYFVIVECNGSDGTTYLSLENAKLVDRYSDTRFAYILYFMAGLIFVLFAGFVILIRNLHKFPEPIIYFVLKFVAPSSNFFTKGYPVDVENKEKA